MRCTWLFLLENIYSLKKQNLAILDSYSKSGSQIDTKDLQF